MAEYKNKLISELEAQGFKVGSRVIVKGSSIDKKAERGYWANIIDVNGDNATISLDTYSKREKETFVVPVSDLQHLMRFVGANPFNEKMVNIFQMCTNLQFTLESICYRLHIKLPKHEFDDSLIGLTKVRETNYNPHVILANGDKYYYQRDYVWDEEDEKRLIDSIYNGVPCGRIVIRNRSFEYTKEQISKGEPPYFRDVVDGKQRILCIQRFINDKFTDSNGYYFSDLSQAAQDTFMDSNAFAYTEMNESVTDADVIRFFLNVNTTGKKMEAEHLDEVKIVMKQLLTK